MNISDKMLDEFISIYNDEFDEEINRKEASELASRVLMLYELLAKTLPPTPAESATQRVGDHRRIGFHT
jgi:hypothetical protein